MALASFTFLRGHACVNMSALGLVSLLRKIRLYIRETNPYTAIMVDIHIDRFHGWAYYAAFLEENG